MKSKFHSAIAQRVWEIVEQIPVGQTRSYGEVAHLAGTSPRAVGRILHFNPAPTRYPCHRVIKANGQLASGYAFGGAGAQRSKLEAEGVKLTTQPRPRPTRQQRRAQLESD